MSSQLDTLPFIAKRQLSNKIFLGFEGKVSVLIEAKPIKNPISPGGVMTVGID